jgi:hypothetical protein
VNKLLQLLLNQTIMKKIKLWLAENGFMGFIALAVAGVAAFFGMWWLFWAAIGGFAGKNWEIIRNLDIIKEAKEKIEDVVDDVKEKIG